jgi:hypothetical protein
MGELYLLSLGQNTVVVLAGRKYHMETKLIFKAVSRPAYKKSVTMQPAVPV